MDDFENHQSIQRIQQERNYETYLTTNMGFVALLLNG